MGLNIVTVAVSQTVAPTPSTLQRTGALISQGGTTLAAGEFSLLTGLSDLTPLLVTPAANTGLTWTGGVITVTTTAPHGIPVGDAVHVTLAGVTPSGYNGAFVATSTGANTFTCPHGGSLSSPASVAGTWINDAYFELTTMATTYFAQGSAQGVYVLELGEGDAATGVAALDTYITANPNSAYTPGATGFFYAYLVPRSWASESTFLDFVADFESTTARTYFFTTMTTDNYTNFTNLMKSVLGLIEAPVIASTEFTLAAPFYWLLNNRPSSTNKVPPFAFTFLFGVTPYPTKGNSALFATLLAAGINFVGTGAEGGISTAILRNGTTMDGRQMTYWYSVDWIQINSDINISNAVINGSNNKQNPLYFDQPGIDRLQQVIAQTFSNAVSFGLANGTVKQTSLDGPDFTDLLNTGALAGMLVINAIPFLPYNIENPGDYRAGEYDGFTGVYIDQTGFIHILFSINVTDFVAQ